MGHKCSQIKNELDGVEEFVLRMTRRNLVIFKIWRLTSNQHVVRRADRL